MVVSSQRETAGQTPDGFHWLLVEQHVSAIPRRLAVDAAQNGQLQGCTNWLPGIANSVPREIEASGRLNCPLR
jgi:hypothetical protein